MYRQRLDVSTGFCHLHLVGDHMTIDIGQLYAAAAARNSSLQIAETMALHQTIKSQVEETAELHKTIRSQIDVTNKQQRLLWVIALVGLFFACVQAVGTVIPLWSVSKKPDQATQSSPTFQQSKEQGSPFPNSEIHSPPPEKSVTPNPAVQGTRRDKAAPRP